MNQDILPIGKLPLEFLGTLLKDLETDDPNVIVGPGIGQDACVIRFGGQHLVFKTDPITFATESIAQHLVTINANDIACMGGIPKYLLVTILLPEGSTTRDRVHEIFVDLKNVCSSMGITLVGGHTEITYGIDRPIAVGFMIGMLTGSNLVRASNAQPGDAILLSKSIPIEAIGILAREKADRIHAAPDTLIRARRLIDEPGISIVKEARIALESGGITAMHDPTEGGLATGLRELAIASGCGVEVHWETIPILEIAGEILESFDMDPLGTLASGSLLVCCRPESVEGILSAWRQESISGARIGSMTQEQTLILYRGGVATALPVFTVDEITKAFS
ncbi:MAG TPA: hydrogenase expression protein [Deltaproteobacteria bacterium]|nr:hydrogenase expression protein [Deltaproteobacteria bacterium]